MDPRRTTSARPSSAVASAFRMITLALDSYPWDPYMESVLSRLIEPSCACCLCDGYHVGNLKL